MLGYVFDFVTLEMADKMPSNALIIDLGAFFQKFLNIILAEVKEPRIDCIANAVDPKSLRNTQQKNVLGIASATGTDFPDAFPYDFYVLRYHFTTFEESNIPQERTKINQKKLVRAVLNELPSALGWVFLTATPNFA